jgi:hypothetical protein
MTRSILAALVAAVVIGAVSGTGCQNTGIGDPCTPESEYSTSFLGFSENEVITESADYQCFSRLCLVNHFRGRVSCPYGQDSAGRPNPPASQPCVTPFIHTPIDGQSPPGSGNFVNPVAKATVQAQCVDRSADKAVYCSCRCANIAGGTDDGAIYCKCPDGYSCTQLVRSIGGTGNQQLTGAYCVKSGTEFNMASACSQPCDPALGNCGTAQGVTGH